MRRQLVIGNWKMNGCSAANHDLVRGLLACWQTEQQVEVAIAPPAVYLAQVGAMLEASEFKLAAQDVSEHGSGAFTGEVSAAMLADVGCSFVIVGHSERRANHAESNELVARKVIALLAAGIQPVLCVGESLAERDSGQALAVIATQLDAVSSQLQAQDFNALVVAYEPVWAIGTGKTATPEQAQEVHSFIRERLGEKGAAVSILYGGSVNAANAQALFAAPDIDGALVGGASLKADDFYRICQLAQ